MPNYYFKESRSSFNLEKLRQIYLRHDFADMVLVAEGKEIRVHRVVMATVSDTLGSLMTSPTTVSSDGKVAVILESSYAGLKGVVDILYGEQLVVDDLQPILRVAQHLGLQWTQESFGVLSGKSGGQVRELKKGSSKNATRSKAPPKSANKPYSLKIRPMKPKGKDAPAASGLALEDLPSSLSSSSSLEYDWCGQSTSFGAPPNYFNSTLPLLALTNSDDALDLAPKKSNVVDKPKSRTKSKSNSPAEVKRRAPNGSKFRCVQEGCKQRFSEEIELKAHVHRFHFKRAFKCPNCSKEYVSHKQLAQHTLTAHNEQLVLDEVIETSSQEPPPTNQSMLALEAIQSLPKDLSVTAVPTSDLPNSCMDVTTDDLLTEP